MKGTITKKDFFKIWQSFGFKKALEVMTSKEPVALILLIN